MLLHHLVVGFFIVTVNGHHHKNEWPFRMVDKIVDEMSSSMRNTQEVAMNNNFIQQSLRTRLTQASSGQAGIEATTEPAKYDFIIIGGGTSGAVLANRLSEKPEWKILLLEAGGTETEATQVPKNWELLSNTPYVWGFTTTPQNYSCKAYVDSKCAIPAGKLLGGTSSINSMVYTRGNARDYDTWADEENHGWCYEEILEYFKKAEDAHIEHFDDKYHRYGGPQYIENPKYLTPLADDVLGAAKELNLDIVDYNGKHQLGVSVPQLTTNCGRRHSTAQAYLEPTVKRPNLVIKPLSEVVKIKISPHTKDIKGVEYIQEGELRVAKAEKEVILAAGAINTPKILILSGIGPKEDCEKHNITHILDLPVGKNLQTRPTFPLDFILDHPEIKPRNDNEEMTKYLKEGVGELSAPGIEAIAFIRTEVSKEHSKYPDIELQFASKEYKNYDRITKGTLSDEQFNTLYKPLENSPGVQVAVTLTHPKSRGYVTLQDDDPLHYPVIEPHVLHEESDVKTLLAGIDEVLKIAKTDSFKRHGATLNHTPVKGCEEIEFATEKYWECAIKYMTTLTADVSGTCRMGPESDTSSIVNQYLKVHNVERLRVADTSVIPVPITGGLTAANIMIAEKAADMIKKDWC